VLAQPWLGLATLVGALIGIPGAASPSALRNLVTGKSSTTVQVIVVVFILIEFALIIIPLVFLELRPEATKAALKHAQDWLLAHARQLLAYTALILGAYLAVSGQPATAELTW
jgi:Sap, sulfolipid-1-addressing protein